MHRHRIDRAVRVAVFAVITGALMIRVEDRELEARFGEAYREYRASVPRHPIPVILTADLHDEPDF